MISFSRKLLGNAFDKNAKVHPLDKDFDEELQKLENELKHLDEELDKDK